jgi:hypothetical protein
MRRLRLVRLSREDGDRLRGHITGGPLRAAVTARVEGRHQGIWNGNWIVAKLARGGGAGKIAFDVYLSILRIAALFAADRHSFSRLAV